MTTKYISIVLFTLLMLLAGCQKPQKKFTASQFDPASKSFAFLKEPLKDIRIIALGESSHGFGSMHTLKGNLVKYLHQELDYDVLVMEAGYGDVSIAWYNRELSSAKQLLNGTVSGNLRSEQMLPLFEYISENTDSLNQLELAGMDPRVSGLAFRFRLMHVISRLEPKVIQDSIRSGLFDYNKTFDVLDDGVQWQTYMDSYRNAIDFAQSILEESREDIKELEIVDDEEVEILERYLSILEKAVDYKFGETYTRGLALRDSLMAETVFHILENEYPRTKIILWGHNGHIEKASGEGDNNRWLGHYLKDKYKDKYYALGMYAKQGHIYQTSAKKTSNFNIQDPSYIEAKIDKDYGKNVFLDLPPYDAENTNWINQTIFGYELEAGGKVNFVPSKRFDGIILLGDTEAPRYLINAENPRRGSEEKEE
ncbi:MAG: erythromycin esterase family protein [Bacteroidota bacterium]